MTSRVTPDKTMVLESDQDQSSTSKSVSQQTVLVLYSLVVPILFPNFYLIQIEKTKSENDDVLKKVSCDIILLSN